MERYEYGFFSYLPRWERTSPDNSFEGSREDMQRPAQMWACTSTAAGITAARAGGYLETLNRLGDEGWLIDPGVGTQFAEAWAKKAIEDSAGASRFNNSTAHNMRRRLD